MYKGVVFLIAVDAFFHHPNTSQLKYEKIRSSRTFDDRLSTKSATSPTTTTTLTAVNYDHLLLDTDTRRIRSLKRLCDQNNALHSPQENKNQQFSGSSTLSPSSANHLNGAEKLSTTLRKPIPNEFERNDQYQSDAFKQCSNEDFIDRKRRRAKTLYNDGVAQSNDGKHFLGKKDEDNFRSNEFLMFDKEQMNSITCNAPAVLLESGPGTGKTSVLIARIAHLLQSRQCSPDRMIVLSFTNKDANALKVKALQKLNDMDMEGDINIQKISPRIWSGTIHAFAKALMSKHGTTFHASGYLLSTASSLRVISTKEMKQRVRRCIFTATQTHSQPLVSSNNQSDEEQSSSVMRQLCKRALIDVNQNMDILVQHVVRSIELWKEAGTIQQSSYFTKHLFSKDRHNFKNKDKRYHLFAKDCIELAMRLGIPFNVAKLALFIYPDYQVIHYSTGTSDPSDLAGIAYELLLADPSVLNSVRNKLQHVILDEYQDLSISQHALLQLIITGNASIYRDNTNTGELLAQNDKNLEASQIRGSVVTSQDHILSKKNIVNKKTGSKKIKSDQICYDTPKLFCAGDMNQSIYGWRGAAPSLTIDEFRTHFPQGVTVPLGTCYRVPRFILKAANILLRTEQEKELDDEDEEDALKSFITSPSGRKAIANMLVSQQKSRGWDSSKHLTEVCSKLSLEGGIMSESSSAVYIRGLWDAREEAKYVASTIIRRSKERIGRCKQAFKHMSLDENSKLDDCNLFDPTDVAIMVRSSTQMKLIEEAMKSVNIPFISPTTIYSNSKRYSSIRSTKPHPHDIQDSSELMMKPVKLMTMHGSKGEEFDDIYLIGWTEGTFPHKSSLSSSRINEERRLAFVALTRARQRVFITYSFIQRVPYFNQMHDKRYVTEQVNPSRFLFDLIGLRNNSHELNGTVLKKEISSKKSSYTGIYWDRNSGIKDYVAGQNLPDHFSKSYRTPNGYTPDWTKPCDNGDLKSWVEVHDNSEVQSHPKNKKISRSKCANISLDEGIKCLDYSEYIESALAEMTDYKKRGSCKKYRSIFRRLLADLFSIERGSALILSPDFVATKSNINVSFSLLNADKKDVATRPISQCTASQLGQYLLFLLANNNKLK